MWCENAEAMHVVEGEGDMDFWNCFVMRGLVRIKT